MNFKKLLKPLFILLITLTGATKDFAQISSDTCRYFSADVVFKKGTVVLSSVARAKLDSVVKKMKDFPLCKIRVEGHGTASEGAQQISWDKVASVVKYLRLKGTKKTNLLFNYGDKGDPSIVNITSSTEDGPDWVPAPIPCFSLHLPRKKRCADSEGTLLH